MLNHRFITSFDDPKTFVENATQFLKKHAEGKKVFCALSGGIDSSLTYLLLKKADINTIPIFIDHGLMRIIRGKEEREHIKDLFPKVRVVDIRDEFLPRIYGEEDAERKRKLFKDAYSDIISKVIAEEKCDLLADGTILPDIEESFGVGIKDLKETMSLKEEQDLMKEHKEGFIKSQHNLNISYDVEATVQPVASLTKIQVRKVLDFMNMPPELVYRKAFPGPALAARIIGAVSEENLSFEKKVHDIVEQSINDFYKDQYGQYLIINDDGLQEPFQAFAAIGENIEKRKVTGMRKGKRIYEYPSIIEDDWDFEKLTEKARNLEDYARLFYTLGTKENGIYDIVIRSVNSIDARTANVTRLPIDFLKILKEKLLKFKKTHSVYYDLTPKPPGTIEYV
jgi:GMP synthase (glutamine-hydrolysing)